MRVTDVTAGRLDTLAQYHLRLLFPIIENLILTERGARVPRAYPIEVLTFKTIANN